MANKEKEIKMEKAESLKDIEVRERAEKISSEDLEKLQKLVNQVNTMQFNIGKIEIQKHTVLHNLSLVQDRIGLFQDKLNKEYGTFDVNIEDGTINWPEEKSEGGNEK
jgi:glutaredoxin 2